MELEAIYGEAFTFTGPLIDTIRAPGFLRGTTFSTGDARINWGGGAFTNLQNLPGHIENGMFAFGLTAAEMRGGRIGLQVSRDSHGLWYDQAFLVRIGMERTHNPVGEFFQVYFPYIACEGFMTPFVLSGAVMLCKCL